MDTTIANIKVEIRNRLSKVFDSRELQQVTSILLDQFGISRVQSIAYPDAKISQTDYELLVGLLKRLETGEPIQYVIGNEWFMGRKFRVCPDVLIPRPETEELVQLVCDKCKADAPRILDVGTGSGCIAVSLSKTMPVSKVTALDVSERAIDVARRNAIENDAIVDFVCRSIFDDDLPFAPASLDVVVSNPPYVTESDKSQMYSNVLDFEPHLALFVPESDPLVFYRRIAQLSAVWLKSGGMLFFEINERFGEATRQMLESLQYANVEVHKDFYGKDRMVSALWKVN